MDLEPVDLPPGASWDGTTLRWAVTAPAGGAPDRVRATFRLSGRQGRLQVFQHGWQSWSGTGWVVPGEHTDPSIGSIGLLRAMHHADDRVAEAGEVRSELVVALADDGGALTLGFDGGDVHDGTFRLRGDELVVEAVLGGADVGEGRSLHEVRRWDGEALAAWAAWAGARSGARTGAPFQTGWCSWYQYFHDVTEADVRANLAAAGSGAWPFEVFQLDDGYQAAIGDWLVRQPAFPTPLEDLAGDIAAAGYRPGIWLAPFLASPRSAVVAEHPDWVVRRPSGRPMIGMVTEGWGGEQFVLDVTRPDVQAHLEGVARELVAQGWTYLKLDFTYAPSFTGGWHDPAATPAQRVRMGYDAIRRGAGDGAFLLGCGAPLGACIGVVDGMRIGPDVAPFWDPLPGRPGHPETAPSVANALRNTVARDFQHRRLWLNDPDCLLLRTTDTQLSDEQVQTWADAVGRSGGMVLVSDDLSLLDRSSRRRFDEVVATARAVDESRAAAPG